MPVFVVVAVVTLGSCCLAKLLALLVSCCCRSGRSGRSCRFRRFRLFAVLAFYDFLLLILVRDEPNNSKRSLTRDTNSPKKAK